MTHWQRSPIFDSLPFFGSVFSDHAPPKLNITPQDNLRSLRSSDIALLN
ncbi:hypothetical protein [Tolypothrix sp. VBCCA 56010]